MQTLPWIVAFVASMLLAAALAWAWRMRRHRQPEALPTEWELTARPVFTADERRVYRSLREALPHHVLLPRLPLVRFCQATEPGDVGYWQQVLAGSQVGFAICSANGRVLAAIDLDDSRPGSRRAARLKQAALSACRVGYLRCAVDQLPSVAEWQLLVPGSVAGVHAPQPEPPPPQRPAPAPPVRDREGAPPSRRSPRPVLWQDTTVFQDSFFPADDGLDDADGEVFEPAAGRRAAAGPTRSAPAGFFGAAEGRRRGAPAADFAATQQATDDEEDAPDERDRGGAHDRLPRQFPGTRP